MEGSREPDLLSVVATTFAGVILGAALAGLLLINVWSYEGPDLSIPLILIVYIIAAAVIVVLALFVLYRRYRSVSDIRAGVTWVGSIAPKRGSPEKSRSGFVFCSMACP